jgi:pyrimidine oxygenase
VESLEAQKVMSRRIKEVAAEHNRTVRTHTLLMVIQGDSDEDAEKILKHYEAGADMQAIENIYKLRASGKTGPRFERLQRRFESDLRLFYDGVPFVGGPERVADRIEELAVEGELDGFLFIFADFIDGLKRFEQQVVPLLRKRGLGRLTPPFAPPVQKRASM